MEGELQKCISDNEQPNSNAQKTREDKNKQTLNNNILGSYY